jgi:hypothetical protein
MYLINYSGKATLRQKMAEERREMVMIGAPQNVLNAFDTLVNTYAGLPFKTAWSTWTKDQQNTYINAGMDWAAVNAWLGTGDVAPKFYFWLGYDTMAIAKTGPLEIGSWGYNLASTQATYPTSLGDFASFASAYPNTFKTAIPAVQSAIQALAAYNGKTLAQTDITGALQQQAQIIYDAANGKISQ